MTTPDTNHTAARRPMLEVYQQPSIPRGEIGERAWHALGREANESNAATAATIAMPYWCWLHDLNIADRIDRENEKRALAREAERRVGMRWAAEALHWVGAHDEAWISLLDGSLEPAEVTR